MNGADASRLVPLVHGIQFRTKSIEWHPHFYDVREVFLDCFRAGTAFVAGHYSLASRSAFGLLRKSAFAVAIGGKADIAFCGAIVCF
jgi:hypothetical protein